MIPFLDLKSINAQYREELIEACTKVIDSGQHSHYKAKQLLVAINGGCKVTLDNGKEKVTYTLNKPNIGLLQDALIWGTMHDFSQDCVLVVFADRYYDESDYIRDYDTFLKEVK